MMPNVQDLQHKVDHAEHLKRITAQIHAASHLDHILLDLHKDILSVFDAQDLTLFAFDSENLWLATDNNSQTHYAKGKLSPLAWLQHIVGIWFQVLFHSANSGSFHLSLAVLVHYRLPRSI